jgi:acetyltransferase-like isoleucine patch superfamily enzyme
MMAVASGHRPAGIAGGEALLPHTRFGNAIRARLFRLLFAHRFAAWGPGSLIVAPEAVEGAENIRLGAHAYLAPRTTLAARPLTGESASLEIGDGCKLGKFNHIYATRRVVLEPRVLTANGVYISDNNHEFRDPSLAVMDQPIRQMADTIIGEGSWLGHNACVVGARVGRHSVVGANAVLTRDVPEFSVVVGAPGRVIRRYDPARGIWKPTRADGTFRDEAGPAQ